jgi:hypothetical protein
MAAVAKAPKLVEPIGRYMPIAKGVVAMSSGTATVVLSHLFTSLEGAVGSVVDAATGVGEMVTFSISGTSLVIETVGEAGSTTGTSLVSYLVWGVPKA